MSPQVKIRKYDLKIGEKTRSERKRLGWTQGDASKKLGISAQQIQKYESGKNRISPGNLYALSKIYDVPVTNFFEGLEQERPKPQYTHQAISCDEIDHLIGIYTRIESEQLRKSISAFLETLVKKNKTY